MPSYQGEDDGVLAGSDRASGGDPAKGRDPRRRRAGGAAHSARRVPARTPSTARSRRHRLAVGVSCQGLLRAYRVRVDGRAVTLLVDASVLSEPTKPAPAE